MTPWASTRTASAATRLSLMHATTAWAAGITIANRMALMALPPWIATDARRDEATRMVAEKLDAAVEGTLAAGFAAQRMAISAAFGQLGPDAAMRAAIGVGIAAAKPAARKARANAKRLGG